uniref:Uncharacterized protein n=1 Tax=Candidatus Kentrum sp. LFY TaxID=2126342 RepID=A0A450WMQ2_9GAMM|nr:MAG: hypothetical protein BECKLFY1418C_GA0070996_104127 [Candidatus Kentron sp. LFY]
MHIELFAGYILLTFEFFECFRITQVAGVVDNGSSGKFVGNFLRILAFMSG